MKYYVKASIAENGKYNAGSKAREDVEKILKDNKYMALDVHTIYGVKEKKWQKPVQYLNYINNYFKWNKNTKKLKKGDILFIQYPLINITFFFDKMVNKLTKKGVKVIAIIHDLDSLRLESEEHKSLFDKRRIYEDNSILPRLSKIISHNSKMTEKIIELGVEKNKIINLEIFDYLVETNLEIKKRKKELPIIIAGNLSSNKAGYLKSLKDIKDLEFNLYGKGLDIEISKNINYKGSFLPNELPKKLEGSFGLVWDGSSINECNGVYGEYLKYNNPHKTSLYLISKLPVIVWNKSALADFVKYNNIGIVVDNLKELPDRIRNLSLDEYNEILKNVDNISNKISKGGFLKEALTKI